MMTPTDIAFLKRDAQGFVDRHGGKEPVQFSAICEHVATKGWRAVDREMFAEWVSKNIKGSIDYGN